jgi:alkane 1-monooxygenase
MGFGVARDISAVFTRHSYWLLVLLPLLMPAGLALRALPGMGSLFAWVPLLVLFGLLPVLDVLIGRDAVNPETGKSSSYPEVLIPVAVSLVYIPVLAWSVWIAGTRSSDWSTIALVGWTLSLGNIGGIAAINVAHELIHRRKKSLQALGGVLLSCALYLGFKLEHPRWHHVKVATPEDPSSAAKGTTVYGQIPRAMFLNTIRAWCLAVENASEQGRALPLIQHELTGWWLLSLLLAVLAVTFAGLTGLVIFICQGLLAISLLEVINYIEHYGLRREMIREGRYEPPTIEHSWNSNFWLSNVILLQLQRHPDHHIHPGRPFTQLQNVREAPQLPSGYAALSIIALFPPLWRKLMHPRLL